MLLGGKDKIEALKKFKTTSIYRSKKGYDSVFTLYPRLKLLIALIIFMVFTWHYTGWIRETFPNPTTGFLIRIISGMILGAVIAHLSFRKFRQEVVIDKNLPPEISILRIKPDK